MEATVHVQKSVREYVHILCTSILTQHDVNKVAWYFDSHEAIVRWSIDLLDWEKVLKLVVTDNFELDELQRFMDFKGYTISEMID